MSADTDLFDFTGRLGRISSLQRRDALLVVAIVVCGFGLRVLGLDRAGIDLVDEGVYAFSALGFSDAALLPRLFPDQHLLSPLAYPAWAGWTAGWTGFAPDRVAIWLSVLFGTLTIPLLFGVVQRAFGSAAGLAAATLLAFNEVHIALSRAALPDAMFGAGLLLSVGSLGEAVVRRSIAWAVGAGFALALVWHTKYPGAGVLAVAAVAFMSHTMLQPGRAKLPATAPWPGQLLLLVAAGGIAAFCYAPWAYHVSALPGGHGALLDFQSNSIDWKWFSNALEQAGQQLFLDGPLSRASLPLAFGVACLVSERDSLGVRELAILLGVLSAGTLALGSTGATIALALAAISGLLYGAMGFRRWLLLIAFAGLLIVTPLVRPSVAALLPLLLVAQCLAACMLARAVERAPGLEPTHLAWRLLGTAVATLVVATPSFLRNDPSNPWRPSDGLHAAAIRIDEAVPPGKRLVVLDEPALAYLFSRARPSIPRRPSLDDLADVAEPIYLVTGGSGKLEPSAVGFDSLVDRLSDVHSERVEPSDLRLLDDLAAAEAAAFRSRADSRYGYALQVLRPKP